MGSEPQSETQSQAGLPWERAKRAPGAGGGGRRQAGSGAAPPEGLAAPGRVRAGRRHSATAVPS